MHRPHAPAAPIDSWIVVIGGFLQTSWSGGLIQIWQWLHSRYASPSCAVTAHCWDDDWSGLADVMRESGARQIVIVGYSWGVGHGAITLARELKARGLSVKRIISCDGVAHPRLLRWRVLVQWFLPPLRIFVPANVDRVDYIRQQTNMPRGHHFVPENGTELCDHGFISRGFTHQDADNSAVFAQLVKDLIRRDFPESNQRCGH